MSIRHPPTTGGPRDQHPFRPTPSPPAGPCPPPRTPRSTTPCPLRPTPHSTTSRRPLPRTTLSQQHHGMTTAPPHHSPSLPRAPRTGWLNDPNGIMETGGRWHVYFQHNPASARHEQIRWGHVSSPDLVT